VLRKQATLLDKLEETRASVEKVGA